MEKVHISLGDAGEGLGIARDQRGIGPDGFERARHDPFRLGRPGFGKVALLRTPSRIGVIPVAHDLVHAPTIEAASQAGRLFDEMPEQLWGGREGRMVDIAVQRLVHSKDKLRHVQSSSILAADHDVGGELSGLGLDHAIAELRQI